METKAELSKLGQVIFDAGIKAEQDRIIGILEGMKPVVMGHRELGGGGTLEEQIKIDVLDQAINKIKE